MFINAKIIIQGVNNELKGDMYQKLNELVSIFDSNPFHELREAGISISYISANKKESTYIYLKAL